LLATIRQSGPAAQAPAGQAAAALANVGAGGRTGAVKTAMSGAFSDQGMG
jgi:hypothetical protein